MKKLTNSLKMAMISLFMLLVTSSNISCSKGSPPDPIPTPVDVCPNLPGIQTDPSLCPAVIPTPIGTVIPSATSVSYDSTVKFTFNFQNDTAVYIGGVYVGKHSGVYTTGKLKKDTLFTISAKGLGGTSALQPILISVGPDPRLNFITQGSFHCDSLLKKAYNVTFYVSVPTGDCNKHTFTSDNYYNPGNREFSTNGSCTPNPGVVIEHKWYFDGEVGFWWHGVTYDSFTIVGNGFVLHRFTKIIVGGVENFDEYLEYFSRD